MGLIFHACICVCETDGFQKPHNFWAENIKATDWSVPNDDPITLMVLSFEGSVLPQKLLSLRCVTVMKELTLGVIYECNLSF